jgi:nitrilase
VYNPQGGAWRATTRSTCSASRKAQESYNESRTIVQASARFEAPFGRVGLSVCYDLRFPAVPCHGRCALIVVPAAFTYTTGRAHWEMLLRARHRKPVLCAGLGAGRPARWPPHLGPQHADRSLGRGLAVLPEGEGVVIGEIDPIVYNTCARACRRCATASIDLCLPTRRHEII